jgi:predicted metal-binding protein
MARSPFIEERSLEMKNRVKLGIIICARYQACAGGKCFRALRERKGAFEAYQDSDVEIVGFTNCGGCPGGNIEYAPEEMKRNGAEVIHLATGFLVGYPPCLRLEGPFSNTISETDFYDDSHSAGIGKYKKRGASGMHQLQPGQCFWTCDEFFGSGR